MPVIQARTREQIRKDILDIVAGEDGFISTATANGTLTTMVDTTRKSGANDDTGKFLVHNTGGDIVSVSSDNGTGTLTVDTLSTAPASGDAYELWPQRINPKLVNRMIGNAIIRATGKIYVPDWDTSLYGDSVTTRFTIPSNIRMIRKIQYRSSVPGTQLESCDALFTETVEAVNMAQAITSLFKKEGSAALSITIGAGASAGDFISQAIGSVDVTKFSHIELWMYPTPGLSGQSAAVVANDWAIRLDSSAGGATPITTALVPALTVEQWNFVQLDIQASVLTLPAAGVGARHREIISVAIEYNQDNWVAGEIMYIDDIRVTKQVEAQWTDFKKQEWKINKEAGEIEFNSPPPYALLRLLGGDQPALFSNDTGVNEIPDDYVVAYAAALILQSIGEDSRSGFWFSEAARARNAFPMLQDVRITE